MSADNFGLIRRHPLGGFALVHGSASSDEQNPPAEERHKQYDTLAAAEQVAIEFFYFEYGWHTHPECYENEDGQPFAVPTVHNLMRLISNISRRSGVDDALGECWEFIRPEWRGLWAHAIEEGSVIDGLSPTGIGIDE